ncbi:DUF1460 domain-containing protein [Candidatus Sumerlaeota bacterium]|nr:DUF1460 domain-containing protein [Candidatus Sumerlaeota bacterium]
MKRIPYLFILLAFAGCSLFSKKPVVYLSANEISSAEKTGMTWERAKELKAKKLFEFTPKDLNDYLPYAWELYPDFTERVVHYARKAIDQPYQIYLLGEFPFEIYDDDPLFMLEKSDCMVFTEHIYAMALAKDWPQFFSLLQRIRYKNGEISTTMRNHTSVPEWVDNNSWLVRDINEEIAPDLTKPFKFELDPNRSLISGYGLNPGLPKIKVDKSYIPIENIPQVASQLKNGDYVCVIRGFTESGVWSGHVGFITVSDDGTVNFLESVGSGVRETPILECVKKSFAMNEERKKYNEWVDKVKDDPSLQKPDKKFIFFNKKTKPPKKRYYHYGYQFFRPTDDPIKRLIKEDGKGAPVVTGPRGLLGNRKDKPAEKKENTK